MLGELLVLAEDDALVAECHAAAEALAARLGSVREQVPLHHGEREAIVVVGWDSEKAQGWAETLGGEYLWRAERDGRRVQTYNWRIDWFGPNAVVMRVCGAGAFEWLAAETGTHRRDYGEGWPTLEAWVEVLPVAVSYDFIHVPDDEVRAEDFPQTWGCGARLPDWDRSVRLTHLPTGLVAFCEGQGSTRRNRDGAMTLLRALLLRHRQTTGDPSDESRAEAPHADGAHS
ncbi:hypothetical protein [Streptosporangium becharense]|uniref:hypothetical protein n=1 Tax=Streptosporangium becharense TaxID=1816182 RepID=UPI001C866134